MSVEKTTKQESSTQPWATHPLVRKFAVPAFVTTGITASNPLTPIFRNIATNAVKTGSSSTQAYKNIIGLEANYSKLLSGYSPYVFKQTVRSPVRGIALTCQPELEKNFPQPWPVFITAAAMGVFETTVPQLFDYQHTQRALGNKNGSLICKDAGRGALGNGTRVAGLYVGFLGTNSVLGKHINEFIASKGIDPQTLTGTLLRSVLLCIPQGVAMTAMTVHVESILRALQVSPEKYNPRDFVAVCNDFKNFITGQKSLPESAYSAAFRNIMKSGFTKVPGLTALTVANVGIGATSTFIPGATNYVNNVLAERQNQGVGLAGILSSLSSADATGSVVHRK